MEIETSEPGVEPASTRLISDADACYRALLSRDNRFDGKFFVGVSSTGIYCRPVCKVRVPRQSNCTFYPTSVAAELAGYRPCLKCRPENAPGWSHTDISAQLAESAAAMIRTNLQSSRQISEIAEKLGVSDRHLRRLFETHIGASPNDYMQTQRRLLAKRLLTDTHLSVAEVASSAGFSSARAMQSNLRKHYGQNPSEIRNSAKPRRGKKNTSPEAATPVNPLSTMVFSLPYRTPYDFDYLLAFLEARSIAGVESVGTEAYQRVVSVADESGERHTGWFRVEASSAMPALILTVSPELLPVIASVLATVRHLFDLDADPESHLPLLGKLATDSPGIRLPGSADGFEVAVRAVLGQQITVKAARTLATRFVERFGSRVSFQDNPSLTHAFPSATTIARARKDSIARLGIIGRRADTIRHLAKMLESGELNLTPQAPFDKTLEQLKNVPGIGDWTAHYLCMRALHWPDAFPAADYGVMKALQVDTPAKARALAEQWRPWRAYAVMCLWASLKADNKPGNTKKSA